MDNFNTLVTGGYEPEDLVADGWTSIIPNLILMVQHRGRGLEPGELERAVEMADFQKMEEIRARVDAVVKTRHRRRAETLYRQFCKRPCFHDEYLPTFNRPNVTLVDTKARASMRSPAGRRRQRKTLRARLPDLRDGFEVGTEYTRRSGYELYGVGARTLTETWNGGVQTLHGMHVPGFPNMFVFQNSQAGFAVNFPHMIDDQAKHMAYIVTTAMERQARRVEVTKEATQDWVDQIGKARRAAPQFLEECTPATTTTKASPPNAASATVLMAQGRSPS